MPTSRTASTSLSSATANWAGRLSRHSWFEAIAAAVRTFPGVLWARLMGAQAKAELKADAGAEKAPAVKF